jgi:hypothetical protein
MPAMSEQLCWRCTRPGTGTCAWDRSKGVIPVEGWTAKEVPWRDFTGAYSTSYQITACPLFDEDEDYYERCGCYDPKKKGRKPQISGAMLKKMEFRFECNWTLPAIAEEFGIARPTASRYKARWKKKQERGGIDD